MLAIRQRHDSSFIDYFTSQICSVPQFFNPHHDEFQFLAQILYRPESEGGLSWSTVKGLALMAIAACANLANWEPAAKAEVTA